MTASRRSNRVRAGVFLSWVVCSYLSVRPLWRHSHLATSRALTAACAQTTLVPERFAPSVESPKKRKPTRKKKAVGAAKPKDRVLMRASRAAGLPPAASPMADRTNSSARRGFDALSPISQAGNASFSSILGGVSPAAKLEDPFYVRERGVELIGRRVLKQFGAAKEKFSGTVVSVDEEQAVRSYLVRYEDGDEEDVVEDELLKCLLTCHQPEPPQRSKSLPSAADTSRSSERSYGSANSSGRSADQSSVNYQGSRIKVQKTKQLKPPTKVVKTKKESKSMRVKREDATRRFIHNRKEYFSQLDEFELECE